MTRSEAKLTLLELCYRADKLVILKPIDFSKFVSREQWECISDLSHDKVLCCSRRKGKTEGGAAYLLKIAYENQGCQCLYLALTRKSAKNIIWRTLKKTAHRYNIPAEFAESELKVVVGSSMIYVMGADAENIAERLRGSSFKLVVIDEIGSWKSDTRYLIDDILGPTLLDTNGTMLIQGTPPPTWEDTDLFYEAWHKKDSAWKKFTILKNPYIKHYDEWVEANRIKKKWSKDHPTYRREWLAEWVKDEESLVVKFDSGRNKYHDLPPNAKGEYILGIDLGFDDATAFSVLAVYPALRQIFIVESYQHVNMIPSLVAKEVEILQKKYAPIITVADAGGLGKSIVQELNQVYHMLVKAADKSNKKANIEIMNSALINNQLFVSDLLIGLINEFSTLQWDSNKKDIDKRFEDHRYHATLYAFREAVRLLNPIEEAFSKAAPKEGTDEYEKYLENCAIAQYRREKQELENDDDSGGLFE